MACINSIFYLLFFKQKTAYEMRISDWSSDVCSSDLPSSSIDPTLVALAHRLADAAGAVALRHFRTAVPVEHKDDASPVTLADREAEAAMRTILAEAAPGHGILGEEHGGARLDDEQVWVLDPIDGTRDFVTGIPPF